MTILGPSCQIAYSFNAAFGVNLGSNRGRAASNFGDFVYSTLPVSFGGDTKSRRSLLSGAMPWELKDPTQGVNV